MRYVSLLLVVIWSGCAVSEQGDVAPGSQQAPVVVEIETDPEGDKVAADVVAVNDNEPDEISSAPLADKLKAEQRQVYSEIEELGVSQVCETTADCRSMPMGAAACGGPSSYYIYSVHDGDDFEPRLKLLSAHSERVEKKNNEASDMMGTCQYNSPPVLACVEKQCVQSVDGNLTE